jgi:citrate lyase subunit beta/citryl-CoA lyase
MKINRPRRSVLYVPAANRKAMAKTETLAADCIIFDLEDAVAPEAKSDARQALIDFFGQNSSSTHERIIRINAASTDWHAGDLAAAIRCRPDAILVPKVDDAETLRSVRLSLDAADARNIALWAMIETPLGIVNIREIASLGGDPAIKLQCFIAGTNDLAKETGLSLATGRPAMMNWLAPAIIHAKAFGVDMVDGVYNDFHDTDGFVAECQRAVRFGFDGKTLIHPSQIEPANRSFSPSPEAIAEARKIIAAFAEPENAGKGVIPIDGRMTERLHAEMAERLLSRVEGQ